MTVGKDNKDKVEDVEMKDAEEEKVEEIFYFYRSYYMLVERRRS